MELRSCGHSHFIQAVKGCSVTKVLNVFRGWPALKFKKVKDLYEPGNAKYCDSLPLFRPKFECQELPVDGDMVEAENPSTTTIKSNRDWNGGLGGGESELDDLNLGTMTLKQIKERCGAKKRKRCIGSSKENTSTGFIVKQETSKSDSVEDEYDLIETLRNWKSRISKNKKTKRKCKRNGISTSSLNALAIVKSEEIPSDGVIFQSNGSFPAPIAMKIEDSETDYLDCRQVALVATYSSCESEEPGPLNADELESANDCGSETQMSIFCFNQHANCVVNKESFEYMDNEDKYDVKPPSSWKYEISNDMKTKRQCRKNSSTVSSENALCVVNSSQNLSELDVFQSFENFLTPIQVKVEVPETGKSDQSMSVMVVDSTCEQRRSPGVCHGMVYGQVPKAADDGELESRMPVKYVEEPQTYNHHVLETSTSMLQGEEPGSAGYCSYESQMPTFFSNNHEYSTVNELSYEVTEHSDLKSIIDAEFSGGEAAMAGIMDQVAHQISDISSSEVKKEASVIDAYPNYESSETVSTTKVDSFDKSDGSQGSSDKHEKLKMTGNDSQVPVSGNTLDENPKFVKLGNRYGACLSESGAEDSIPDPEASITSSPVSDCRSLLYSNLCSSSDGCLDSVTDEISVPEEKQLPISVCAKAGRDCSIMTPCIDESATLAYVDRHHSKPQHHPERLLSSRKAISPTSQKMLCKAMESNKLDDKEFYKYTRKLCYGKLADNKSALLEGKKAELIVSPKQIIRKANTDKNSSRQKGILRVPHISRSVPRTTGSTSIQSCSENAISFSQQQMRDIETIAAKLGKELKSMKDIVEETLNSKVHSATPSRYSADEVRVAIQNATKVEESARKWLSMMTRDCNRFCKIMKLTQNASAASGNVACKEKRKIVFADEAGKKLCDIQTYENDLDSFNYPIGKEIETVD